MACQPQAPADKSADACASLPMSSASIRRRALYTMGGLRFKFFFLRIKSRRILQWIRLEPSTEGLGESDDPVMSLRAYSRLVFGFALAGLGLFWRGQGERSGGGGGIGIPF